MMVQSNESEALVTTQSSYFFPLPNMRPSQERSLRFAEEAWASGLSTVILQLPVGVGKSPLAIALAKLASQIPYKDGDQPKESAWALTTQKVLQRQYVRDFDDHLANISAKSNYPCDMFDEASCDHGMKFQKQHGNDIQEIINGLPDNEAGRVIKARLRKMMSTGCTDTPCGRVDACNYRKAFARWIQSPISLTNIAYFMNLVKGARNPSQYIRDLLIIDEAHLLDDEIIRFCEISLPKNFIMEELRIELPEFEGIEQMRTWVDKAMIPAMAERKKMLEARLVIDAATGADATSLMRKVGQIDNALKKAFAFIEADLEDWVVCTNEDGSQAAKPIHTGVIGPDLVLKYGKRRLLMSGTILDKELYCAQLGLRRDDVAFYEEPSPFPPDNRWVVKRYVGSMGLKKQGDTTPKLIAAIKELLERHKDEKGVIHTGSYRLNKIIMEKVGDPRLVTHVNAKERDEALSRHFDTNEPTVLVSPSMTTGVDLKDDLARWGLICKVPFPFLGDARIKALFENDKRWYLWKTAQEVMQACGRIVRSNTDYGVMYVLDSDFENILRQAGNMFPRWWYQGLMAEQMQ